MNPDFTSLWLTETEAAARALQIEILPYRVSEAARLPDAFSGMTRARVDALADVTFFLNRTRIAELASTARLPTMLPFREHVEVGGLMSYDASIAEQVQRAAIYVDRILKTAKALGLTIPPSLPARADQLIE